MQHAVQWTVTHTLLLVQSFPQYKFLGMKTMDKNLYCLNDKVVFIAFYEIALPEAFIYVYFGQQRTVSVLRFPGITNFQSVSASLITTFLF